MTILSVICASLAASSLGYREPESVWVLSSRAESIVLATVEAGPPGTAKPTTFAKAAEWTPDSREPIVRLRVLETFKGANAELLEVEESRDLAVGTKVLAFLECGHGRWRVVTSANGVLSPSGDDLPLFLQSVAEAVQLQASSYTTEQKVSWAVRTAAHPATRWHGTYALTRSDELELFSRTDRRVVTPLDEQQRQLLANGFIAQPRADETTAQIAALLRGHVDPRFDRALIGAVDALVEGKDSLAAFQAMDEMIERAGGSPKLLAGLNPHSWTHDLATLRAVWAKAKVELKLPAGVKVPPTQK